MDHYLHVVDKSAKRDHGVGAITRPASLGTTVLYVAISHTDEPEVFHHVWFGGIKCLNYYMTIATVCPQSHICKQTLAHSTQPPPPLPKSP